MSKLLIKNIKGLINAREIAPTKLSGAEMQDLSVLSDAWLAVEDGLIADFGEMKDWPGITDWRDLEVIDAEGKFLFPSWVDSHTHLVFAANREGEFVDRINGLTYQEIAAKGGGILNSARKLASMSEDELFDRAHERAWNLMRLGTGAMEIKSGYGLNLEAELKMLRVIRRLKEALPIPVKSTFLGAHAIPQEFAGNADGYMAEVIEKMLPRVVEENLADYVDIFIEEGYFSVEHGRSLLEAAAKHGIQGKIHVNQFSVQGGVELGVEMNALSVDHLEELNDADIESLKRGNTMAVALPSCSFFLGIPYTPARKIIDSGLPLALATDYNPGSTPSGNMNFVNSLACIQMKMTPEEAFNASSINGAYAMGLENEMGSITPGKRANFFLSKSISSYAYLPYAFAENCIDSVFVNGEKL